MLDLDDSGVTGTAAGTERSFIDLERADAAIELARVKAADADVRIVRAAGYVRVVEDALRKTAAVTGRGSSDAGRGSAAAVDSGRSSAADFEAELGRARDDLAAAQRETILARDAEVARLQARLGLLRQSDGTTTTASVPPPAELTSVS